MKSFYKLYEYNLFINAEKNNRSISDFVYTGTFKNIEKILYNSRNTEKSIIF